MKEKFKMDKLVLFLIPIGVAVNFVGGQLISMLGLPFYLDSIGTIAIGALCGAWPGALVGLVSNLLNAIGDPLIFFFAPLNILFGVLAAVLSKKKFFSSFGKSVAAVAIFAVVGGGLGAVISWGVYGLDFGIGPASFLAIPIYKIFHLPKFLCQFLGETGVDIFDKIITVAAVVGVFKAVPVRLLAKLPLGGIYIKESDYQE